jgi:lipid II:glycine glycyltransferase (peptidoglycan interpeptide bridge formation enzyme)
MLLDMHHAENSYSKFLFNQYFYLIEEGKFPLTFIDNIYTPSLQLTCVETNTNEYVSGYHAPFAGIESNTNSDIELFLGEITLELSKRNARSLEIKQAPSFYQTLESEEIHKGFLKSGFVATSSDCNQYLSISPQIEFEALIEAQKRRRLKNAKKMGMHVQLFEHIDLDDWYQVYAEGRMDRGFPITISNEKYNTLSRLRPDIYTYAGVFLKEELIASAIFVRVSKTVMYYFVAASSPRFAHLSPTVLLIEAMYNKALNEQCEYLDLGISSVSGELNEGLHAFKRHIGAQDCIKNTYLYTF